MLNINFTTVLIVSKLKLQFFLLLFSEKMMKIVSSKSSADTAGKIIHF